jgi:hypothetical protein
MEHTWLHGLLWTLIAMISTRQRRYYLLTNNPGIKPIQALNAYMLRLDPTRKQG